MGSDVAIREDHVPAVNVMSTDQLKYIAHTEFVPKGLRGNLPAILACVATGRAIGIDDMSAIRSIHIIDGKATFSAELMVMLVRRRGHSITGDVGADSATVKGTRADNGDTMTCTWTLDMAKRAGLLGKGNWKNYPESMLWARAVSQLCRMLFADCFAGGTYTTEELGEERTDSAGEPQEEAPTIEATFSQESADTDEPASPADDPAPVISDAQRKRLRAIQHEAGVTDEALKAMVDAIAGVSSSKDIPRDRYEALVEAVEAAGSTPDAAPGAGEKPWLRVPDGVPT